MLAMASDLDGTLVFHDQMKEEDKQAIKQFREAGNLFGICSGRTLKGILRSCEGVIDCDFYIASSGSLIVDSKLNILYESLIDPQTALTITQKYQDQYCVLVSDDQCYHIFREYKDAYGAIRHTSFDDLKHLKITGISIVYPSEEEATRNNEELKRLFPTLTGHQNLDSIDITTSECSKGNAVLKIKELFEVDCIGAIGDHLNDLPMIKDADLGFTFPYAPAICQQTADYIVDHEYEAFALMEKLNV